ncbi:MAG TPA: SRPBCC family protein [Dehalococcoidia bacterium]|nr:SRPBCC family protein [Dehalococcoidia bacterium]
MSDGTIEQTGERVTFRFERRLSHAIDTVWKAITDPAELERWLGQRPEIELRPGGRYVSYHGSGDRVVDRVLRIEPPTLFEHTFWEQVNPTAVVTWRLSPIADGCLLVLTHSLGMADIRGAAATVARGDDYTLIISRNGAGWHRLLDKLEAALAGHSMEWSEQAQKALQERYAAMLA